MPKSLEKGAVLGPKKGQKWVKTCFSKSDKCCAQFGPFLAIFRPFLGHIVELKGTRGLFDTGK